MASDIQELRCFQHCRKDTDLVCFRLPELCPLCLQSTATTESRIPPYVLPSPFSSSVKCPYSVILKPTQGDFIRNYTRACNLHIGVTDGHGKVYDFDEKGLNQGAVWPECVAVTSCESGKTHVWDQTLDRVCQGRTAVWHKSRYHEDNWNCFDFVLEFLLQVRHPDVMWSEMSKAEFCDNFLTGKTKRGEQYIHLYRQALETGCVVVPKKAS